MKLSHIFYLLTLAPLTLAGCMPHIDKATDDSHKISVEQALNTPTENTSHSGSLWGGGGAGLLADSKASRIGDLVTVLISENAKATRSLDSKQSKSSARDTGLTAAINYGGATGNASVTPNGTIGMTNSKTFNGAGSTNNSDTLTASVTSVVTEVFPNGNMRIVGKRQLVINHEPQQITFSGVIRPVDIAPNNTITSSKVAQADISYGGTGALANTAHEGWLSQTLDIVWPF
ncbi:MAG: flagellar basal body L-ring protein FlgH [Mariprofundus sp.]|nr:flagellar basal body L-ring protein FlgH [Mariprofundus sp.]